MLALRTTNKTIMHRMSIPYFQSILATNSTAA
uniref:Uncharacterized protein n=1 Tax=Rhizophora mucronata TaxID=61149 RepID=A0A2P2PLW4_RHIMU